MAAVKSPSISSSPPAIAKGAPLSESSGDRALTLELVLRELAADALVDADVIEALRTNAKFRSYDHPLTLIAEQKWRSNKPPKRV